MSTEASICNSSHNGNETGVPTAGRNSHHRVRDMAAQLAVAWRGGHHAIEVRTDMWPRRLNEGYRVQDELIALLGLPVLGWKVGLAGRNSYRRARLQRPVFGRILSSRCFGNGETIAVPRGQETTVELEIALVLAEDVNAHEQVTPHVVASAHLGFEIVASRYRQPESMSIPALVADNVASYAVVVGDAIDLRHFAEVAADACVMAEGHRFGEALRGDDLPDPLSALGHLAYHLSERGQSLKRGDIVFSGTITQPFQIAAPCRLTGATSTPLVSCHLTPTL
jgi:2-keto-4-pentenoate hydratase